MMYYTEPEPMDFEYTSPPSPRFTSSFNKTTPSSFSTGPFAIPDSFFERPYSRSSTVANKVAETLQSFSLNDDIEETQSVSSEEHTTNEPCAENRLTLFKPLQARRDSDSSDRENIIPTSVEQNKSPIPNTTIHHNKPTVSYFHSPNYSPTQMVYIRNESPPPPTSTVSEKYHTALHIAMKTLALVGLVYVSYHAGSCFVLDLQTKYIKYENSFLNLQYNCRQQYEANLCSQGLYPALAQQCTEWEQCLYQSMDTPRLKLIGETVADLANGFIDNLTGKAVGLLIFSLFTFAWALTHIIMGHPSHSQPN